MAAFLLALLAFQERGGSWVWGVAALVGMTYTALGTHRTASELAEGAGPTI
jgi:hypothetical protein